MNRAFVVLFTILVLAISASYAALPEQVVYWNKVLPNTPMPSAIKDLLKTSGHGHVGAYTGKGTGVHVGKGGVIVNTPPKEKPASVPLPVFSRYYRYTESQMHDPQRTLYFLEKDLHPGTKMTLHFTPTTSDAAFVSRREADSIPFSTSKLPEILSRFSVEPGSREGESMKRTLSECEVPAMAAAGEGNKYCATSLESMVEFSTTTLGTRNVVSLSTAIDEKNSPKQRYEIASSGVKKLPGPDLVVCHPQPYAYAVFYCHTTRVTKAYQVSMIGKDGARVEAVAICHTDTSGWNPKNAAFQVLGVKPGAVPVCHFLPQDHLVWSRKI